MQRQQNMTLPREAFERTEWAEGPPKAGRFCVGVGLRSGQVEPKFHFEYRSWEFADYK